MLKIGVSSPPKPLGEKVRKSFKWCFVPSFSVEPLFLQEAQRERIRKKQWDWICVASPRGFLRLREEMGESFARKRLRWAVVGPRTRKLLESCGIQVSFCPSGAGSEAFVSEFYQQLLREGRDFSSLSILLPQAEGGRDLIFRSCLRWGMKAERLFLYRTVSRSLSPEQEAVLKGCDWLLVTSPSAIASLLPLLSLKPQRVIAMGAFTKRSLQHYGIEAAVLPNADLDRIGEVIGDGREGPPAEAS